MSRIDPFKKAEKIFTEWVKVGNRHIQHVYYLYKDGTWAVDKDTYGMTVYKDQKGERTGLCS